MKKNIMFIGIVLLQICFLTGLIYYHVPKIKAGTPVLLETEPVDPFSVFRGRYVILNYKISRINSGLLKDCRIYNIKKGESIYVLLEKEKDGFFSPSAVYRNRPKDAAGVLLKGEVDYMSGKDIHLKYGIESFFLSEKSADEIEEKRRGINTTDWDGINEQKRKQMENLSEEDKRIYKTRINQQWFNMLDKEIAVWVNTRIIDIKQADNIRAKYKESLERIKSAENIKREEPEKKRYPLSVEISVTRNGQGYPVKLLWEGKEYR